MTAGPSRHRPASVLLTPMDLHHAANCFKVILLSFSCRCYIDRGSFWHFVAQRYRLPPVTLMLRSSLKECCVTAEQIIWVFIAFRWAPPDEMSIAYVLSGQRIFQFIM